MALLRFPERERKPVNSTHSGQNENVNQSDDVPPVERNGGQTYQDITIDPEVSTAVEPITSDLEVSTAVEPITSDLEVSTAVEPITSDPEVSTTVEPITSDPEVSTAVEPITSDPEVSTAVEPITSDPEVDDDCSDDDIFQDLDDINSFSGEICEGGFKIPLHDGLQEGYSEPIPLELQHMHSEDKKRLDNETRLDSGVPEVPADDAPEVLNNVFSGLSPQWKNWWVRGILTLAMISFFFMAIDLGPMALMMSVLCVQIKCFHEIITIGYSVYNCYHLPWFRTQSWYFLLCANYFFYGETFADYFFMLLQREEHIRMISKNHHFISFALYLAGFCMFVLSLVKKHYRLQFYMFGWTHVTLLIVATQSHLIIRNLFEGMIWFIMPISCVICNDTMAYVFGFFLGRTPLIKLSPKKTWEGFIGGFFSTVVVGVLLSYMMAGYSYFVCPVEFNIHSNSFTMDCEPSDLFQLQDYGLPSVLQSITGWTAVKLYPFQIHSIALSSFASVMGPFGGFFASGFKRAFQIKDFANTIPGHGGFMDRFDCQFLMATFVNVYIGSFIREPNPSKIIQQLLALRPDQQLYIFNSIKAHLTEKGLLPPLEDAANLYGQLSWRLLPW